MIDVICATLTWTVSAKNQYLQQCKLANLICSESEHNPNVKWVITFYPMNYQHSGSSIFFKVIDTISSLFIFFKKNFERTKNANQVTKQTNQRNKSKRTLNNKSNNFLRTKTSKRVENWFFRVWCFLFYSKSFLKTRQN